MNENTPVFRILNSPEGNPLEGIQEALRKALPYCDLEGVKALDQSTSDTSANTAAKTFDQFLKEKFDGIGIGEFMKIYTKKHVGEAFCLPIVPPDITCRFMTATNPEVLAKFMETYKQSIGTNPFTGNTFMNLHNDTVYEFTLIRADFDLLANQKLFWRGYHHQTDNFAFFINSSIQFDLTVIYQKL